MNNFGTGALKGKKDKRDFQYKDAIKAFALSPFDWNLGYDIEEVINKKLNIKNQNGSGSCGGQAWSYYGQVLDPEHNEKSAKFIYAQTFIPPAGTFGRDNCKCVKEKGWGDEALTTSYENGNPPSEAFMQRKEDITEEAFKVALLDKALSYAQVNISIDEIAQAIRDNKGCVIGITGKDNGTWRSVFPTPPDNFTNNWRHWVYCGKAKLVDGKKYIGFLNSWGENVGNQGWQWISEEYIKPKWIFDTYTLVYNFPKFIFTKTLMFGVVSNEVKELQKRLGVIQTGFFGTLTLKAVKYYQSSHQLVPDGIVGPLTRLQLNK